MLSILTSHDHKLAYVIRIGLYGLIAILTFAYSASQNDFYNFAILKFFYLVSSVGFGINIVLFFKKNFGKISHYLVALSFLYDLLGLSYLLIQSELNQSLFLFLNLLVIFSAAMVFGSYGAFVLAACFAISTTVILALGPELKTFSFFFLLALNNVAFFSVAAIASTLAGQISEQGRRLHFLREIYESVVSLLPTGVISFDQSGQIIQGNPAASRMLQQSNVDGLNISIFFPWKDFLKKPANQKFSFMDKANGNHKFFEIQWLEQNLTDEKALLLLIEDQTELKRLQFTVQQTEKLAAVGQLAAGIAHEIRNPLAGISGSIELLNEQVQTDEQKKLFKIILKEIARLNNLVGDFLDFAKPWSSPNEKHNLSKVLQEVWDLAMQSVPANMKLDGKVFIDENLFIVSQPDRLKQAFLNILINSIQAMQGRPKIQLELRAWKKNQEYCVEIKDSGVGMTEEQKKRMFEPFHTTKAKGTGLGLAITHKILETHKASIYVESELNVGTRIEIRFPEVWI